jgi:hypothetical protein
MSEELYCDACGRIMTTENGTNVIGFSFGIRLVTESEEGKNFFDEMQRLYPELIDTPDPEKWNYNICPVCLLVRCGVPVEPLFKSKLTFYDKRLK